MFGVKNSSNMRVRLDRLRTDQGKSNLIQNKAQELLTVIKSLNKMGIRNSDIAAVLMGKKSLESLNLNFNQLKELTGNHQTILMLSSGCFTSGHFIEPNLGKIIKNDIFKSGDFFSFENSQKTQAKLIEFSKYLVSLTNGHRDNQLGSEANVALDSVAPPPPKRYKTLMQEIQTSIDKSVKDLNNEGLTNSLAEQYTLDYDRSDGVYLNIDGKSIPITDLINKEGKFTKKFSAIFNGQPESQITFYQKMLPILFRQDYRSTVMMPVSTVIYDKINCIFPGLSQQCQTKITVSEPQGNDVLQIKMEFEYNSVEAPGDAPRTFHITADMKMSSNFVERSKENNYTNKDFGVSEIKISKLDFTNPMVVPSKYSR